MTDQRKLVRGRWVVVDDGEGPRAVVDGAVLVEGGRIAAVGGFDTMVAEHPDASVIGDGSMAVLPGLVNAHHHSSGVSGIQNGVADDILEPWILAGSATRPQDGRLRTMIAAGRLLMTGVTSVLDMISGRGPREGGLEDEIRARFDGYAATGIRATLAPGTSVRSVLIHGEDDAFLASLPAGLAAEARAHVLPDYTAMTSAEHLAMMEDLIAEARGHPRLRYWFGPPGPQWVEDEALVAIAEAAERLDVGIQTHGLESLSERIGPRREYGRPMVEHLHALGVLSDRLSFAHGVWLTDREIEILAETGAGVSHNPSSNLRLRAGIAPLQAMREAGVALGLGMDGTTIGDDEDMFAEMRLALRLARPPEFGRPVPTPADILSQATAGGARLLRQGNDLGRIAPGLSADLVLIDVERLAWPYVAPEVDPVDLIVLKARQTDVRTVLVGGEVVVDDGRPTLFDLEAAGRELADRMAGSPYPHARADLIERLTPYLTAWYGAWPIGEQAPRTIYNSSL